MKTREGIELKKLKTFPSMEWGENGGSCCDIYYKGKKVAEYFNDGNGGCARVDMVGDMKEEELKDIGLSLEERCGMLNNYNFPLEIRRASAIEEIVDIFLTMKDIQKLYKKHTKDRENKKMLMAIDFMKTIGRFWNYKRPPTQEEMTSFIDANKMDKKSVSIYYIENEDFFNNL